MKKSTVALKQPSKITEKVKQLGIDMVNPVMGFLARLIPRIVYIDEDKDGKVEGGEILNTGYKLAFDAFGTFNGWSWNDFIAQLRDADPEERKELIQTFATEFELSNDVAEILIEDWMRHLDQTATLVIRTKKFFTKDPS